MLLRTKIKRFIAIGRRWTTPPPPQRAMTIRFPVELYDQIKAASAQERISANRLVVLAMQAALAELAPTAPGNAQIQEAQIQEAQTTQGEPEPCPSA